MKKKIISGLITLSFIFVFTYGFVNFIKPEIKIVSSGNKGFKWFEIEPPSKMFEPEKPKFSIIKVEYNEYIKTISGAAIAWAVKEICQFIFLSLKKLFKKKEGEIENENLQSFNNP